MKKTALLIIVLLFISNVSAFAVSSAYYKDNPLKLQPGKTFDFMIVLQNPSGPGNVMLKANILSGSEVLQVTDSDNLYTVPEMGKEKINLKAVIPENAKIGQVYPVNIELITVEESNNGEFGFGSAIGQNFDIIVARQDGSTSLLPPMNSTLLVFLVIGIIGIALTTILIVKKRKK